jgi:hypothetical protein
MLVLELTEEQITGYFVIRGDVVPFWNLNSADYESFTFKKVDPSNKAIKRMSMRYSLGMKKVHGLPCALTEELLNSVPE